jgi:hypothetical protein
MIVVTDLGGYRSLRSSLVRLDVLGFQRRFAFNPRRIGHLGPKN